MTFLRNRTVLKAQRKVKWYESLYGHTMFLRLWFVLLSTEIVRLSVRELYGWSSDGYDYILTGIVLLLAAPFLYIVMKKGVYLKSYRSLMLLVVVMILLHWIEGIVRYAITGTENWSRDVMDTLFFMFATAPLLYAVARDFRSRDQDVQQLTYLAYRDHLTGLPNREMFQQSLAVSIEATKQAKRQLSVMMIDLDRFKNVNDTFGHTFGDQLLKEAAERLKNGLRSGDIVSRQGGDEFSILVEDIALPEDAEKVAQKIIRLLNQPFTIDGHVLRVGCSVGIAVYPRDGEDPVTLMKNADTALYRAKDRGKNGYKFFQAEMNETVIQKLVMEEWLNHALEHEEFVLFYQPQVDIFTHKMNGMEALVRWKHPRLGMISPAEFIPLSEETGLILPLGEWVLRTACKQNRAWQLQGFPSMKVAVNISPIQFHQQDFVQMVLNALQESELEPQYLELEITEGIAMVHVDQVIHKLQTLRDLGVHIAMDDFGTGYSSLSYLKKFPIHKLKIAQQFMRDITADPDDAAIVQAIMAMAHSLKLNVIAEGVETEAQLAFLLDVKCQEIQGYIYSRPLPVQDFTNLLERISKEPANSTP